MLCCIFMDHSVNQTLHNLEINFAIEVRKVTLKGRPTEMPGHPENNGI